MDPIERVIVPSPHTEAEIAEAVRVMRNCGPQHPSHDMSTSPTGGLETLRFEAAFCELMGCADAVAVTNGTAALELAACLSGLQKGDEVIVPAHTYVAGAVPFARTGATVRKTWE